MPRENPSHTRSRLLWVLSASAVVAFVIVNAGNAVQKGGDADVFFEGGRRLLQNAPLYEASGVASGFIGPPMQALFFAPFAALAALSPSAAKLVWYALNLACLTAGIVLWRSVAERHMGAEREPWRSSVTTLLPLAATLLPIQTNFEHQNMNALLLALTGGAVWLLYRGASKSAGVLIGTATALKTFPGLLIVYLLVRAQWKAALAATVTTAGLTLAPVLVIGRTAYRDDFLRWLDLSSSGWPIRSNNQSLIAAIDRLTGAWAETGVRSPSDAPVAFVAFLAIGLALVLLGLRMVWRTRDEAPIPIEMAAFTALSVLISPIAWDHYWVLLFPAFLFVYQRSRVRPGGVEGWIFWVAAILTSGISRVTVGRHGWTVARQLSVYTVAGVLLYLVLVTSRRGAGAPREPEFDEI